MTLPPPSPIDSRSGIRKRVRTPPTSTTELAARGNPRRNWPTSVEVPPTSITIAAASPERNGQSEYRDIEEETHHAMGKHDAPQITALDLHIRHLKGHADAEGKIHEIPIVGLLLAGKVEPADRLVFIGRVSITIVAVSVMQSENRIHKKP